MVGNPGLEEVLGRMILNSMWLKEKGEKHAKLPKVFVDGYTGVSISLVKDFVYCKTKKEGNSLEEGCFKIRDGKLEPVEGIFYIRDMKVNPAGLGRRAWYDYGTTEALVYDEVEEVERKVEKMMDKDRWLIRVKGNDIKVYINAKKGKVINYKLIGQQDGLYIIRTPPMLFKPMRYEIVKGITINGHKVGFEYEVMKFGLYSFGGHAELIYPFSAVTRAVVESPEHGGLEIELYPSYMYLFLYPLK